MTRRVSITRPVLLVIAVLAVAAIVAGLIATRQGSSPGSDLTAIRESATPTQAPAEEATDGDAADADAEDSAAGDPDADADAGEEDGAELNEEAEEQAELIARKREALAAAVAAGTPIGQERPIGDAPSAGWAGEVPFETTAPDDWEPAVAADPSAPWVYVLVTRYGVEKPCSGNCPTPHISLRVSRDGGATFGSAKPLCACKGSGQFDPIIEVVPANGTVYAVYMNGFNILFTRSTDHGATWSSPKPVYGKVSWNDKPVLATSDDGKDVYITFNGPTGGDPWIAQSHDSGTTWTQAKLVDSNRYFFAFDADVAPDGTVYLAQTGLLYGGGGNKGTYPTASIDEHVFVSNDKGTSWTDRLVASVEPGLKCSSGGCTPDYWLGHTSLSVDATGKVVVAYDGAATREGLQAIVARRSTDRGATWSAPVTLSAAGEQATAPAMEAAGSGDVRAWYQQTAGNGNVDQWNTWYRRSADGGSTWGAPVKLSDATGGAGYKTPAGYLEPYGDYGELAITSSGKSFAVWGEGTSYDGPGGVWYNREP